MLLGQGRDLGDRIDRPQHIRHVHQRDDARARADHGARLIQAQAALSIHVQKDEAGAAALGDSDLETVAQMAKGLESIFDAAYERHVVAPLAQQEQEM